MAKKIKISFSVPNIINFNTIDVIVFNSYTGYNRRIIKNFTIGAPTNVNSVQIGANLAATLAAAVANLSVNDADSIIQYSSDANSITIDFNPPGVYGYSGAIGLPTGGSIALIDYTPPAPPTLTPLVLENMSIEIIDTYVNSLPLLVENTQLGSPKIIWDGGDDIYEPFMSSKLSFNMLVKDGADGKFFHLYTGDEKRYKVKVFSVDPSANKELIWQGFLLPDLYSEPYQNGAFFVDFVAVDMIGLLKGKLLKPWMYNNRIPLMRLLGLIMENTGLQQEFIVAPSLIPVGASGGWVDINIPLYHYVDENNYVDCYDILKDVLIANGLTICSFRGYWFIKGITRKFETTNNDCFRFDYLGFPIGLINVENAVSQPIMSEGTPTYTAVTPWKKVLVTVSEKNRNNLLTDEVVKLKNDYLKSIQETNPAYQGAFYNGFFDNWIKNASIYGVPSSPDQFSYYLNNALAGYLVPESVALTNYFECKEKPYILSNVNYDLSLEGELRFICLDNAAAAYFQDNFVTLKAYELSVAYNFQLLINNVEIASNRPSFGERAKFEVSFSNEGFVPGLFVGIIKYTIKGSVLTSLEGPLTVRILAPIWFNNANPPATSQIFEIRCNKFEISLSKNNSRITENCSAIRAVNFSQVNETSLNFTSSKNEIIRNNIGLLYPQSGNYITDVPVTDVSDIELRQNVVYSTTLTQLTGKIFLNKYSFDGGNPMFLKIFGRKSLRKNLFVSRASGLEESFQYIAGKIPATMVFIDSLALIPILPANYKPMDDLSVGDELHYFDVPYGVENVSQRVRWVVFGFTAENTLAKTLANAIHYLRPDTGYSLEATFLKCIFPNELIQQYYYGQNRNFIPTRIEIDLSVGKSTVKSVEAKFQELNDISYE